jgi:hypothetical protein
MKYTETDSTKFSIEANYFEIKSIINASSSQESAKDFKRVVPFQLTPQRLADFLGKSKACWVLEDFHKMDENEKVKLSQIMKVFMDKSTDFKELKIIALGAVNSGREVVKYDNEMRNRIAEIEVKLMSEAELLKILSKGEDLLNVKFDNGIKNEIVKFSNGLASVCHAIALNLCENKNVYQTVDGNSIHFKKSDLEEAIKRYMNESSDSVKEKFDKSLKQKKGKFKNAELIFEALCKFPQEGATHSELIAEIKDIKREYPASNLTKNLKKLQTEEKGAIIMEDPSSGKYLFAEPLYRPFAMALLNKKQDYNEDNLLKSVIGKIAYEMLVKELESNYIRKK